MAFIPSPLGRRSKMRNSWCELSKTIGWILSNPHVIFSSVHERFSSSELILSGSTAQNAELEVTNPVQTLTLLQSLRHCLQCVPQELGLGGFLEGLAPSSQYNQDEQLFWVEKALCLLSFFLLFYFIFFWYHLLRFSFFPHSILFVLPL